MNNTSVLASLLPSLPPFSLLLSNTGRNSMVLREHDSMVSSSRSNDAGMRWDANTARFEVAAVCNAHGVESLLGRFCRIQF